VGIEIWSLLVLGLALGCGAAESEPAVSSVTQALLPASINPFNEPYTIGAWYFTAWSQTNVHQAFWSQNPWVLGRWDPWGGVRDAYSNPDGVPNNTDHSFIPRKPAIGFYDLMDQRVMDKHIVQAASRGLSYFAFYWYWDADAQAESQESTPIHRFVSSPNKGLMKFMIAPMRDSMQAQPPPVTLTSFEERLVPYVVDTYFADSSYLATSDGRPVITDWDFGLADSDHAAGMQFLKEYTFAKLAKYPLILKMEAVSPDDDGAMCFQNNLGPYYLLRPGAPQSIDYGQMMQHFAWPAPSGITSDMVNLKAAPITTTTRDSTRTRLPLT
jgi:hypothetical protein